MLSRLECSILRWSILILLSGALRGHALSCVNAGVLRLAYRFGRTQECPGRGD